MNQPNDDRLRKLLRDALPPIGDSEAPRDLWPAMLRRVDQMAQRPVRISWLDWGLAGAALVWLLVFPEGIPTLLYHF